MHDQNSTRSGPAKRGVHCDGARRYVQYCSSAYFEDIQNVQLQDPKLSRSDSEAEAHAISDHRRGKRACLRWVYTRVPTAGACFPCPGYNRWLPRRLLYYGGLTTLWCCSCRFDDIQCA